MGTINNCDADNITVNAKHWAGAIGGYTYANYSDCDITGSKITASSLNILLGDKAGALVGYMGEGTYNVSNCTATNVTISALRDAGGLVGAAGGNDSNSLNFNKCTVQGQSSVKATGVTVSSKGYYPTAGGVIGRALAHTEYTEITVADTVNVKSVNSKYAGKYVVNHRQINYRKERKNTMTIIKK